MKKLKIFFGITTFFLSLWLAYNVSTKFFRSSQNPFIDQKTKESLDLKNGDIIFQTSQSSQCEAVRLATNSKFSHCGIVFFIDNKPMVLEAVQPVKLTNYNDWIMHGENQKYVVKRLKNSKPIELPNIVAKMQVKGKSMLNKDYDLYFGWENDKIYCSELVWKIYQSGAKIELCKTQKLGDFNLQNPTVKTILSERYGNNIPLNQTVVSPESIEKSTLLETIIDTY